MSFLQIVRPLIGKLLATGDPAVKQGSVADLATRTYWSNHNVTLHHAFATPEESLRYLQWRNDQYFRYIELMPVKGHDGKVVLDFGCGPGHDLVGFGVYSSPARLLGMDISPTSIDEAKTRLALHKVSADLICLAPDEQRLPLDDASVDHIHSSGVLHHTPDPAHLLRELRRVLKPNGTMNIMVYNYESLWLHLYVAYQKCLIEGRFQDMDIRAAFSKSTDGEDCPISQVYRPAEFLALARDAGLGGEFTGAAISMYEASLFPIRYDAVRDMRLREESRRFLLELEVDRFGFPTYRGHYAGVDGCYGLRVAD